MIETVRIWFADHRRLALGLLLVAGAVLAGLLLAWRGEYRGRYGVPTAGNDMAAMPPSPPPAAPPVTPPVQAPPVAVAPPPAADPSDDEDADDAADRAAEDQDRIADAIDHAARKALRRGEPVHWHKAGAEGYVVVSEPVELGDRVCRNVSATVTGDDGETRSNAHRWCMPIDGDDDEWEPE